MRERRTMLGLTQQQVAGMLGITYQQAHKYEKGVNRISAGRLHALAQGLGVDVGYFYEGLGSAEPLRPTARQRRMIELRAASPCCPGGSRRRSPNSPARSPARARVGNRWPEHAALGPPLAINGVSARKGRSKGAAAEHAKPA